MGDETRASDDLVRWRTHADHMIESAAQGSAPDPAEASALLTQARALLTHYQAEVAEARHALLINRDHVVGTEAEIGRLNRDVMQVTSRMRRAEKRVTSLVRRRDDLQERVRALRERVAKEQQRSAGLKRHVTDLEQQLHRPSAARRAVRRLLRGGR